MTDTTCDYLMFVGGYVYKTLLREARRLGLRWTAILVLKDLDLLGPLSQQALVDIEQIRKPTMTVLLQDMEQRGWIVRTIDPKNRRSKLVRITAKGTKSLRAAGEKLRRHLATTLDGLPKKDRQAVNQGLLALVEFWMERSRSSDGRQ